MPPEVSAGATGSANRSTETASRTVITRMRIDAPATTVWKALLFYEQIEGPPSIFLRLLLPTPRRTQGKQFKTGEAVFCHYSRGYLVKRIVAAIPAQCYSFEVIEQNLRIGRGIRLHSGSYLLEETPEGTEVSVTTRYLSPHQPRWVWNPLESTVCHAFHRHILRALRANALTRKTFPAERSHG